MKNKLISEVKIVNAGDLLISNWLLKSGKINDKDYNFDTIFEYITKYIQKADLAVINLETSYGGNKIPYSAFPKFNTPDEMIYAAKKAGFDVFLTASNHAYDLGLEAVLRRIKILEKRNLHYLGTRKNESEKFHKVIEVNGIKIGMLNYTRETIFSTKDKVILNAPRDKKTNKREYIVVDPKARKLISSYNPNDLDSFYKTVNDDIKVLKEDGAEIIICYIHWGKEYDISFRKTEENIAKKMNELGIDLIVGSHPHVVQPIKNYTSSSQEKTTPCIYSLGNFVSSMNDSLKVNNVEYVKDGALLEFNIQKYENGLVIINKINVIPTWVYIDEEKKHYVIPLDINNKHEKFNENSYNRTMNLVKEGIDEFNNLPKIIKQPNFINNNIKKKIELETLAIGSKIKYQWEYSYDKNKWKKVFLGNKNNIKIKKDFNNRIYRCIIKNSYGKVYTKKIKIDIDKFK